MKAWKRFGVMALAVGGVVSLASTVAKAGGIQLSYGDVLTGTLEGNELGQTAAPGDGYNSINPEITLTAQGNILYSGEIYWGNATLSSGSPGDTLGTGATSFVTFCTQLFNDVSIGSTQSFNVSSLSNTLDVSSNASNAAAKAVLINDLVNQDIGMVTNTSIGMSTRDDAAAGIQLAIWKIVYDYSALSNWNSSGTGTIQFNSSTGWGTDASNDLKNAIIDVQDNDSPTDVVFGLVAQDGTQNQSVLAVETGLTSPPSTPTPKPLAGGVVLFGALGAFASLRRRVNKVPVPVSA